MPEAKEINTNLVLEDTRQINLHRLIQIPHANEFADAPQRARWGYICNKFKYSRLVCNGTPAEFTLIFSAWKAVDHLPVDVMTRTRKSSIYLQYFEGTYE